MKRSIAQELRDLILLSALPFVVLIGLLAYFGYLDAHSNAEAFVRRQAARLSFDMAKDVGESERGLQLIAARADAQRMDPVHCDPGLGDLIAINPEYVEVNLIDREGWVICGATPPQGGPRSLNVSDREWFQAVMAGKPFAMDIPRRGPIVGGWISTAAVPVRRSGGGIAGVVSVAIDLVKWEPRSSKGLLPEGSIFGVLDPTGTVVTRYPEADKWVGRNNRDSQIVATMLRLREGVFDATGVQGIERIWAVTPIPGTDWLAFAGVSSSAVLRPSLEQTAFILALTAAALAIAVWLALRASRSLAVPIAAIAKVARARVSGADALVPVAGPSEIEDVALELNRMILTRQQVEESLKESESRYHGVVSALSEGIVMQGRDGAITTWNQAAERILGLSADQLWGLKDFDPSWQAVHEDGTPFPLETHPGSQVLRTGVPQSNVVMGVRKPDATLTWVSINAVPIFEQGDALPASTVVSFSDITERKRAESALLTRSRAAEQSPASIVITGRDGNIEYVNPRFEEVTGYAMAEVTGKNPRILKSGMTPVETYSDLWRVIAAGGEWRGEMCNRRRDGELFWESVAISGLKDESGKVSHYIAVKDDITERKRIEQALLESAARVSALSRRLIEVQEEQSRQLARELHDEIGQVLTAVRLNLKLIEREDSQGFHREALAEGLMIIERAISQGRGMSLRLRPPVLDELGVLSALRWLVKRQSPATGLHISLEAVPEDIDLPRNVSEVCYRIVQEALTNVARHAGASEVVIRLERTGDRVKVAVQDNGCGFDAAAALAKGGLGLLGMEERVKLVGGTLQVQSRPGAGTQVRAEIGLTE